MKSNRWLGLAVLAASVQFLSAADITGKVTLKGTPPPEKELPVADGFCGPESKSKTFKGRVFRTGADAGLADVVVYLKEAPAGSAAAATQPKVLDQHGCQYEPYILAVQVNEPIVVKNSDPVLHNVHTRPTNPANKEQNLAQMAKGPDLTFKFAGAEPFMRVECNVHPYMVSYISVFDHPYFAVTDKDGNFTIKNVPKGNYTVVAAHRRAGNKEEKVAVAEGNAKADFSLEVPKQ
jgi:plastocyanin